MPEGKVAFPSANSSENPEKNHIYLYVRLKSKGSLILQAPWKAFITPTVKSGMRKTCINTNCVTEQSVLLQLYYGIKYAKITAIRGAPLHTSALM